LLIIANTPRAAHPYLVMSLTLLSKIQKIAQSALVASLAVFSFGVISGSAETFTSATEAVSPNASFTNLLHSYGILETLAGNGFGREDVNYWQDKFEGGAGTNAALSRPHYAMADRAGKIYIADKNSHSVLRLETDGTIHTHAGTHVAGYNGEGPMPAARLQLNFPNALWVRGDGTVYVLDTDNGCVRRIDTNGIATTLFHATKNGKSLAGGRMLWVKDDESLAYFGNKKRLKRWTPNGGVETYADGFDELGTFYVESSGDLIAADRGGHLVYRLKPDGSRQVIAGNGTTHGGGDGFPALQTGLNGPRGIWPAPTGGYLFLLHDGSQLWHMNADGILHLVLNGAGGKAHGGDGKYFYEPSEVKVSEGRSVSVDHAGNIILCESDYGYIRRIRFRGNSQ
jgi:sugar lactone lactonase YvrE